MHYRLYTSQKIHNILTNNSYIVDLFENILLYQLLENNFSTQRFLILSIEILVTCRNEMDV